MKQMLFAIKDQLSNFKQPFILANERVAEREFKAIVNDKNSGMYYAPNYFDLYHIGYFDNDNGKLEKIEPKLLCNGSAVLEEK